MKKRITAVLVLILCIVLLTPAAVAASGKTFSTMVQTEGESLKHR